MKNLLKIKNLHVNVDEKEILKGLDLEINKGEMHVIMGPNGAGKSTLLNSILNNSEYIKTKGKILFENKEINNLKTDEIARLGIFLSFQTPEEIPGISVLNFLRTAKTKYSGETVNSFVFKDEVESLMDELNIKEEYAYRNMNVGFSGGEKKKCEILQMLTLNPKLAIFDEIDSGLDVDAIKTVSKGIRMFSSTDNACLIITHSTKLIEDLDVTHVHILKDGKIIKTGDKSLAFKIDREGFLNEED